MHRLVARLLMSPPFAGPLAQRTFQFLRLPTLFQQMNRVNAVFFAEQYSIFLFRAIDFGFERLYFEVRLTNNDFEEVLFGLWAASVRSPAGATHFRATSSMQVIVPVCKAHSNINSLIQSSSHLSWNISPAHPTTPHTNRSSNRHIIHQSLIFFH